MEDVTQAAKMTVLDKAASLRNHAVSKLKEALHLVEEAEALRVTASEYQALAGELERLAGGPCVVESPDQTTESPTGAKVEHVNINDEDHPIRYVWLLREQTTDKQRAEAYGTDEVSVPNRWAIEVDQLSPLDRTRYADKVCTL